MKHRILLAVLASAFVVAPAPIATAQMPATPRALGMGGAYVGLARGQEAVMLNPANLGLPGSPWWSVAIPQLGLGLDLAGARLGDYSDLSQGDRLPAARRQELLAAVPDQGGEVRLDARFPLFAMQNRGFGFAVTYNSIGEHTIGRDLLDLYLNGYEEGRTDYTVDNTAGRRAAFVDVAAAYGRRVGAVGVGATVHYYHGRSLGHSRLFEPRYDLQASEIELDYVGVRSPTGHGFGLDVGAAYRPKPELTLSAAVGNLLSRMTWSEELRYRHAVYTRGDLSASDPIGLLLRYEHSEQPLTDAGTEQIRHTAEGLFEEAYFPATLRAGAALELGSRTDLALGYQGRLTSGRLAGRWDRMLSAGVQQAALRTTMRAGFATNLDGGTMWTAGISMAALELGFARVRERGPLERDGFIATLGVNVRTTGTRD